MLEQIKKLFGKNKEITSVPLEQVQMKIKVTKDEPTPFSNYAQSGTTTTVKKSPIYIMIYNSKPITNKSLKFLGNSRKTGYPMYEVLDKTIIYQLKVNKIDYKEIIMSNGDISSFVK